MTVEISMTGMVGRCTSPSICSQQTTKALNDPLVAASLGFKMKAVQGLWGSVLPWERIPLTPQKKVARETMSKLCRNHSHFCFCFSQEKSCLFLGVGASPWYWWRRF